MKARWRSPGARAARPRVAGRLTRRVRDFATAARVEEISREMADAALTRLDVDQKGLDAMDIRYLKRLAEHHNGGPVGVETLAAALAEARDTLEDVVEPYLIQEGLLLRTSRGRMLGDPGWRHLGLARRSAGRICSIYWASKTLAQPDVAAAGIVLLLCHKKTVFGLNHGVGAGF